MERLQERVIEGRRLGRHVHHDPRSLRYPFKAPVALASHRWSTNATPILDQGNLGSCTGNATVGALLCGPMAGTLNSAQISQLNEDLAVKIYSRATEIDPFEGTYQPDDTGSDGLDAAKAAKQFGFISGYSHALSLNDALAALTVGPIICGVAWHDSFDEPSGSGLVELSGSVRGGHEICFDEIDAERHLVWFRNSWSRNWGVNGRANMSFTTFGQLLDNDGDATVLTPLSVPAPTPIPTPTPLSVDQALANATRTWSAAKHVRDNAQAAAAVTTWRNAKGL